MEAQACGDGPVVVVGGGNSAGQAALFLGRSCAEVAHRHPRRDAGDLDVALPDRPDRATPADRVRTPTEVTALLGEGQLEAWSSDNASRRSDRNLPSGGLFVFIGAKPSTEWLAGQLADDEHGFLLTGKDIPAAQLDGAADAAVPGDQPAGDLLRRRRPQRVDQAGRDGDRRRLDGGTARLRAL